MNLQRQTRKQQVYKAILKLQNTHKSMWFYVLYIWLCVRCVDKLKQVKIWALLPAHQACQSHQYYLGVQEDPAQERKVENVTFNKWNYDKA